MACCLGGSDLRSSASCQKMSKAFMAPGRRRWSYPRARRWRWHPIPHASSKSLSLTLAGALLRCGGGTYQSEVSEADEALKLGPGANSGRGTCFTYQPWLSFTLPSSRPMSWSNRVRQVVPSSLLASPPRVIYPHLSYLTLPSWIAGSCGVQDFLATFREFL